MPKKLAVKIKNGRTMLVEYDMPDPDEVKRLWRQGKSAQWILEQFKRRKKKG